jgi:hypothetical protein
VSYGLITFDWNFKKNPKEYNSVTHDFLVVTHKNKFYPARISIAYLPYVPTSKVVHAGLSIFFKSTSTSLFTGGTFS